MSKPKIAQIRLLAFVVVLLCSFIMIAFAVGEGKVTWRDKTYFVAPEPKEGFCLLFSGNWQGNIEPCGCSDRQLGGIDRRTKSIRALLKNPEDGLLLEAGPIIDDTSRQSILKLQTFMQSMKYLEYDAVSLTAIELIKVVEELGMGKEELPVLLCTNMDEQQRKIYPAVDHITKKIKFGDNEAECFVMAVNDPSWFAGDEFMKNKLKLSDPKKAILETMQKNGVGLDKIVIVMVPFENKEFIDELKKIEAIDIIVVIGSTEQPERINDKPMVITTGQMGKYITRVDIKPGDAGQSGKYKFSTIEIDAHFPLDPNVSEFMDDYQLSMEMERLIEDEVVLPRLPLPDANNPFAGNSTCFECHKDVYDIWKNFGHANAMPTLEKINRQYDPSCVKCHSVGMNYVSGYRSMEKTPDLAGVGCEMCHGPGTKHNNNFLFKYQDVFTKCEDCHNNEHSPNFQKQREEYFQKIKHWQNDKRKYWE